MISRDEIIRLTMDIVQGRINQNEAINLISEYCIDKGKPADKIGVFIQGLSMFPPQLLHGYMMDALEHFSKKYNLTKLQDSNNRIIQIY